MGAKPLDPFMEELIRLETLIDEEDGSNEYEEDRAVRRSRRRPLPGGFSRGHDRDIEKLAIDPSSSLRWSLRGWGCSRMARTIFASALGFFIAM